MKMSVKVFLSYSNMDSSVARRLAEFLRKEGFEVWDDSQIFPGENWAERTAQALRDSNAMVVLITPNALRSSKISNEIGYALGKKDYKGRLIPVVVESSSKPLSKKDIPWVLNRFQPIRLTSRNRDKTFHEISQALRTGS